MIAHSSASPKFYLFNLFFFNPLVALPDASVSEGPNLPKLRSRVLNERFTKIGYPMATGADVHQGFRLPESVRAETPLPGRRLELCLGS